MRLARVGGRSDDILELPALGAGGTVRVQPFHLRAPFVRLHDVRRYQIVHRADGLTVRVVLRDDAPRSLPGDVRAAIEKAVQHAGASCAVAVEVVDRIERERGHAAKLKLVRSEAAI